MSALLDLLPKTSPLRIKEIILEPGQISRIETPYDGFTLANDGLVTLQNTKGYLYPSEISILGRGLTEKEALDYLKESYFAKLRKLVSALWFCNYTDLQLFQCIRHDIRFEPLYDPIYGNGVMAESIAALLLLNTGDE